MAGRSPLSAAVTLLLMVMASPTSPTAPPSVLVPPAPPVEAQTSNEPASGDFDDFGSGSSPPASPTAPMHVTWVEISVDGGAEDYGSSVVDAIADRLSLAAGISASEVEIAVSTGGVPLIITAWIATSSYATHVNVTSRLQYALATASAASELLGIPVIDPPAISNTDPSPSALPPLFTGNETFDTSTGNTVDPFDSQNELIILIAAVLGSLAVAASLLCLLLFWRRRQRRRRRAKTRTPVQPSDASPLARAQQQQQPSPEQLCAAQAPASADGDEAPMSFSAETASLGVGGTLAVLPGCGTEALAEGSTRVVGVGRGASRQSVRERRGISWADREPLSQDPMARLMALSLGGIETEPVLEGPRPPLRRLTEDDKWRLGLLDDDDEPLPPNMCEGEEDDEEVPLYIFNPEVRTSACSVSVQPATSVRPPPAAASSTAAGAASALSTPNGTAPAMTPNEDGGMIEEAALSPRSPPLSPKCSPTAASAAAPTSIPPTICSGEVDMQVCRKRAPGGSSVRKFRFGSARLSVSGDKPAGSSSSSVGARRGVTSRDADDIQTLQVL